MKQWFRRRAAVAVFVFALTLMMSLMTSSVAGAALVPCRLVLGQLDEFVSTRTRTQCHRVL